MAYTVLLHREFGAPGPTPADWHDSMESLEATINRWRQEGWTFPGGVIEEGRDKGLHPVHLYRVHTGSSENPGLIAVRQKNMKS
jgi:hypothetical protein